MPKFHVAFLKQFKFSRFQRQYSWRNGKNGITVGSVAAVQIVGATVADHNKNAVRLKRERLIDDIPKHGPSTHRLEHLGPGTRHARPLPSCQNHDDACTFGTHFT